MIVEDVRPCLWCRQALPPGHPCVGDQARTESMAGLAYEIAMREDASEYGSPSDLDHP